MALSKSARKRLLFYSGFALALLGLYAYQPVRVDLFPKPIPNPNPPVDPNSRLLFSRGSRVMIVTAHPDDTEFYLGGLLTKLARAGAIVDEVVCTDGDKGYYLWQDSSKLRKVRRAEQTRAAIASHVRHLAFLGYPDGRLFPNTDVIASIRREIDRANPDYVVAFDGEYPPRRYHRDHLNSGIAALAAARGSSASWALLFATHAPNYTVDITNEWETQKKLLAIHASQFSGEHLQLVTNMVEDQAVEDGDRIEATYGESFRCVRLR